MVDLENQDLASKAADAAKKKEPREKKKQTGGPGTSPALQNADSELATPSTFKRGGKVKKTGKAKVHKGERVLTKRQNKAYTLKNRSGKLKGLKIRSKR